MHVLILGGESCNFQPCFRGGSVIFVPKGGGGPCVFYQPHFQMLRPTPPILFDQSLTSSLRRHCDSAWSRQFTRAKEHTLLLCSQVSLHEFEKYW